MNVIAKFPKGYGPEARPSAPSDDVSLSPMDRRVRRNPLTPRRIFGAVFLVLVLALGAYGYVRYGLHRALTVSADRVTISQVRAAPFNDYAPVTGSVAPEDTVFLDTIEGGQVTEVLVDAGAQVEAGQLLARLKNTRLELEVLGREAQITEQQNNLANAQLALEQGDIRHQRDVMQVQYEIRRLSDQLERRRPLEGGAVSPSDIHDLDIELEYNQNLLNSIERAYVTERELSERNVAQLQDSIDRMTRSLELFRVTLADLAMTAPIAGQLTTFDLNVGEVVGSGQRIGQVDTVGSFKISALVDEFYLGRIAIGQPASVEIGGREYELEVTKVYPNVTNRQFQVDLSFRGEGPTGLRRGQTVRPRIELGETADSLVLANGPYYDETGGLWVLVVSGDGATATRRDVTLGRRNPEYVEVLAGLGEGDRVITSSYQAYRDIERIDFN